MLNVCGFGLLMLPQEIREARSYGKVFTIHLGAGKGANLGVAIDRETNLADFLSVLGHIFMYGFQHPEGVGL